MLDLPWWLMSPEDHLRFERYAWAVVCRSKNELDGARIWFDSTPDHPSKIRMFDTRKAAREYITERYGHLRDRPDLKAEPHGWKMPKVVQIRMMVDVV